MKVVRLKRAQKVQVGSIEIVIVELSRNEVAIGVKAPRVVPITIHKDDGPPGAQVGVR